MEKINIVGKLRDIPKGTKLYSPLAGVVIFDGVCEESSRPVKTHTVGTNGQTFTLSVTKNGLFEGELQQAECMLYPSNEMRDWTKFFKRGDVVYSTDNGMQAVFKGWMSDDYTSFYASFVHYVEVDKWDEDMEFMEFFVESFCKETEEAAKDFFAKAEKHYNGKYNPETLQVEPDKLKCPFKPFDKVLVRDNVGFQWKLAHFSHYDEKLKRYICVHSLFRYCIPYEGNEHLLGTCDDPM